MSWLRKALTSTDNPKQMVEKIMPLRAPTPTPKNNITVENTDAVPEVSTEYITTPLQQQLWLSEIRKSLVEAQVAEELFADIFARPISTESDRAFPQTMSSPRKGDASPSATSRSPMRPRSASPRRRNWSPSRRVAAIVDEVSSPRAEPEPEPSMQLTKYYYEQRDAGIVMDYSTFDDDAESVGSVELLFNWLTCKDTTDKMRIDHRGKLVVATDSLLSDNLSWHEDQKSRSRTSYTKRR